MDTALVMIDFQMDYFPGGRMELVGAEAAAAKAQDLLHHCRQLVLPQQVLDGLQVFRPHVAATHIFHNIALRQYDFTMIPTERIPLPASPGHRPLPALP